MRRALTKLLMLAILAAGMEFATDYAEVLESTPLAALPDGHTGNDGHDPSDHALPCDNCHFGGVHLTGFIVTALAPLAGAASTFTPWSTQNTPNFSPAPPNPPPIA